MSGLAVPSPSARAEAADIDRLASPWAWPVAVLALCHGQAIASFQILNVLVDPIRASLHISDTQYSLLQGLAVAIFSAALGVPAARWADRHSRRNVILAGALGWSLATVACAFVISFPQFFVARVVMGIGEVFLFPAALALIAELVPREKLSTAIACFGIGGPLGGAAAMFAGGWLIGHAGAEQGWRTAFLACGVSGLLTAALLLTVADPRRTARAVHPSFAQVLGYIAERSRLFLPVTAGMICLSLCAFAGAAWAPTALSRAYGIPTGSAGELTAASSLLGGVLLTWTAGWLVDRLAAKGDPASPLTLGIAICLGLASLVGSAVLLVPASAGAGFWLVTYSLLAVPTVLGGTEFQMITAPRVRAQVMAIYLLLMNLIALSLGPFIVAYVTDHVFEAPERVHQSLAIVIAVAAALGGASLAAARKRFSKAAAARFADF